jgi:formylglycine-generating enzyme required for sulfatase activity
VQLAEAALKKLAVGIFPTEEPAPKAEKTFNSGDTFRDCDDCPEIVVLPAGTFTMGSPASEKERNDNEGPQHKVTIPRPFAVGKFEVTRGEFAAFVDATGHVAGSECWTYESNNVRERSGRSWKKTGFEQTDDHPAVCLDWHDAKAYVEWLAKTTGEDYRLLSEAEWEYAARAGTTTPFSTGKTITTDQANFNGNYTYNGSREGKYRQKTTPVRTFDANSFGLYDMHGNVWEWVEDCWNDSYRKAPADGSAHTTGDCEMRVLRGGSWYCKPRGLRSASRGRYVTSNRGSSGGFRVARTLRP